MEPRTTCSKCGADILEVTAKYNHGQCAPCWANRPSKRMIAGIQVALFVPFYFLALPFIIGWHLMTSVAKRMRFPFKTDQLKERLFSIFQNRRDVRLYLRGLVDGYFRPGLYGLPFDPNDLAHHEGLIDGSALKEQKISISDLPTKRVPFARDAIGPHPPTKVGLTTKR